MRIKTLIVAVVLALCLFAVPVAAEGESATVTVPELGLEMQIPEEYSYVWGLPAWFFYSCVAGYPVVTLILWIVVRKFFADIPLDEQNVEDEGREGKV